MGLGPKSFLSVQKLLSRKCYLNVLESMIKKIHMNFIIKHNVEFAIFAFNSWKEQGKKLWPDSEIF